MIYWIKWQTREEADEIREQLPLLKGRMENM